MKPLFQDNDIGIYSTHNEGKHVIAKRFIRTLKNKICKHMTDLSKNVYIDKLNGIVIKCNKTYQSTVKMKSSTYIDCNKKKEEERSLTWSWWSCKNIIFFNVNRIISKSYTPNWSEEASVIRKF